MTSWNHATYTSVEVTSGWSQFELLLYDVLLSNGSRASGVIKVRTKTKFYHTNLFSVFFFTCSPVFDFFWGVASFERLIKLTHVRRHILEKLTTWHVFVVVFTTSKARKTGNHWTLVFNPLPTAPHLHLKNNLKAFKLKQWNIHALFISVIL